ncbi:hypothetical protein VIGAN_02296800 [Vigna angularis var. angularis]|uniref:Uncharacterized protein n=1 Tax=Vigna angularis var. angularis TaxID=157739 RepID=A0A0S3RHG4_PHAAN|nr:hypothetical protein VIGAN_02296800 [Vigna angularis var. angularis]
MKMLLWEQLSTVIIWQLGNALQTWIFGFHVFLFTVRFNSQNLKSSITSTKTFVLSHTHQQNQTHLQQTNHCYSNKYMFLCQIL